MFAAGVRFQIQSTNKLKVDKCFPEDATDYVI